MFDYRINLNYSQDFVDNLIVKILFEPECGVRGRGFGKKLKEQ